MIWPVDSDDPLTPRAPPRPTWRGHLQTLTGYAPVLLMALLALGTGWLVKNSPVARSSLKPQLSSQEADYVMSRFSVQHFGPQGMLQAQIEGDTLMHFPASETLEVAQVRLLARNPQGLITQGTAKKAWANDAGSEIKLMGDARLTRQSPISQAPPLEFSGEFLYAYLQEERVVSHLPVKARQGSSQIQSAAMYYDHRKQELLLQGGVRAVYAPPRRP